MAVYHFHTEGVRNDNTVGVALTNEPLAGITN